MADLIVVFFIKVEPRTDICQVIIPDKDMKILQSTGVLGLLNVQEPCVIMGTSLAGSNATPSAAEEVLSKCKIPARVTTEEEELTHRKVSETSVKDKDKIAEGQKIELQQRKRLDSDDIKIIEDGNVGATGDSKGSVGTSKVLNEVQLQGKESTADQVQEKSVDDSEVCSEKDNNVVKNEQDLASQDASSAATSVDETEDITEHAQRSTEDTSKSRPVVSSGAESFKAKRLRLDQITGKLSIQRQTQITAKREVIKQKIDHLKTEEITKCTHGSPQSYQRISPNPPPYPCVTTPTPRMAPQYVDRYPAPTLLTYGPPTQCTGPCCAYHPSGNSYPPVSSCGYHLSSGGLPRETYVVYGPGGQTSFPVIAPTISSSPCK